MKRYKYIGTEEDLRHLEFEQTWSFNALTRNRDILSSYVRDYGENGDYVEISVLDGYLRTNNIENRYLIPREMIQDLIDFNLVVEV